MSLSPKKLILLGLGVILLIAIPITVFLVQKQQQTRSNASVTTSISLIDPTTQSSSKTVAVGDPVSLDAVIDPGANWVGQMTLVIKYDSSTLATSGAGLSPNIEVSGSPRSDINYIPGQITVVFNPAANDPLKAIQHTSTQQKFTLATITFQAIAATTADPASGVVKFDSTTDAYSLNTQDSNVNVIQTLNPAHITITEGQVSASPTPTGTPTPTATPTIGAQPSATPTPTTQPTATPTLASTNQVPVCSSLAIDVPTSGTAPYTVNFTATGTDSDGTIGKVSFNFGEGAVQDVTSGGGIGTNNINVPASHIYSSAGTFTASAVLTDNSNGVSAACSQTITVSSGAVTGAPVVATQAPVELPTATSTLAPTGPGQTILGIGVLGIIFTIIGAAMLFIL